MSYHFGFKMCAQMEEKISTLEKIPIFPILPTVELQPERPEGNRRRAKLHLGKIYF